MSNCTIDIKSLLLSLLLLFLGSIEYLCAQNTTEILQQANRQYAFYESEKKKGAGPEATYSSLIECYRLFSLLADTRTGNSQYSKAAKNRLRAIYPDLFSGASSLYHSRHLDRALELLLAYADIPGMLLFRSEFFERDQNYQNLLFGLGGMAHEKKMYNYSIRCFEACLNAGNSTYTKECYMYLNVAFLEQKDYAKQEDVLERAIDKYPLSLDFHYNLVNVYLTTGNMQKLLATIDKILAIDPNDVKVLPIKARVLERQGNNMDALALFKRLYLLNPNDLSLAKAVARNNFNVATKIINDASEVADIKEYTIARQKADYYLYEAQDLFQKILDETPTSQLYMKGLAGVYLSLDKKDEYNVLNRIIEEGDSYVEFPTRLSAYMANKETASQQVGDSTDAIPLPVIPAELVIHIDSFIDGNNNKVIDAGEMFAVQFSIENRGEGDAYNLRLRMSEAQGYEDYFDGPREIDGGTIPAGTSKQYVFRYIVKKDIPSVTTKINIYAFEANGFDADPSELTVITEALPVPRLTVAAHQFLAHERTSISLGSRAKLQLAVQNLGTEVARNVRLKFGLQQNVLAVDGQEVFLDSIVPGAVSYVDYNFLVNRRFRSDSLSVMVYVEEDTHSSTYSNAYSVKLGDYLAVSDHIAIEGKRAHANVVADEVRMKLDTELLNNIPQGVEHPHRYALIIGNEDYSITGANAEINVPYAVNDALVFKEYCVRTFGVPLKQVRLVPNATAGMMHETLDWLANMASSDPEAEIFFYYSGHGNNDESTKEPYLIPVDITGRNIRLGISLASLYDRLSAYPVKATYIFLDACFSGGYKSSAPMVAQKAVRIVPKTGAPRGNSICFASSSGDQTSSVYHDKRQGYFTYFLIKAIKDSSGNITLEELFDRTSSDVKKATALIGKMQEPQYTVSSTWQSWNGIKL